MKQFNEIEQVGLTEVFSVSITDKTNTQWFRTIGEASKHNGGTTSKYRGHGRRTKWAYYIYKPKHHYPRTVKAADRGEPVIGGLYQ
jgi:hypothetical protein